MFRDVPGCSGMFHVHGFIDARSGAASCNKRGKFWRETDTPLWLLIGRIIFLTREKTWFAILIGRIIFFTCENHRSHL